MFLDRFITTIFLFIEMFVMVCLTHAQVNTEAMRKGDLKQGLHPVFELDLGVVAGNSNLLSINTTLRFDYFKSGTHTFLIGSRQLSIEGEDNSLFINKGFVHLRQTRSINSQIFIEGYGQKEFNQFIHLKDRSIVGSGLRIHWPEKWFNEEGTQKLLLYTGLGFMWEQESISDAVDPDDSMRNLIRSTNYLVIRWEPDQRLLIQATLYFQPDIKRLYDFRVLFDGGLTFTLTSKLSIAIKSYARYDHDPPAGLNLTKYDVELTNRLTYAF